MTQPATSAASPLESLGRSVFVAFAILSLVLVWHMAAYLGQGGRGLGIDFAVFHFVGQMLWQGRLTEAYAVPALTQFVFEQTGVAEPAAPWAYPPQGNFIVALLALLPMVPSYVVFVAASYGAYLAALLRLDRAGFQAVYLLIYPTILIEINTGQNGFLTGTLAGLFALGQLRGRAWAGVPLGLLAFKPQLGLGLALVVLLQRRWGVIAVATATLLGSCALATLAFGPQIWTAFFAASAAASAHLAEGLYPFRRMVSTYASLASLGVPFRLAFAAQILAALLALGVILASHLCRAPERVTLGLALVATLAVSPYGYDYDLPIFGLGACLLLPFVRARTGRVEQAGLALAYWIAAGTGLSGYLFQGRPAPGAVSQMDHQSVSLAGLLYLGILLWSAAILRRSVRT